MVWLMRQLFSIFICFILIFSVIFIVSVFGEINTPVKIIDLNDGGVCPSITDDGSKISFAVTLEDGAEIFVVNSDGSYLNQITNSTIQCWSPNISGDGSKIVFEGIIDSYSGMTDIYVVNSDGSEFKRLTDFRKCGGCSISDDGSKVAFSAELDGDGEVFVINSDGSGLKQLTSNSVDDYSPCISGDGSKIVFTRYYPDSLSEIFVINSDGSGLKQLTSNSVADYSPSISDDGEKIAFVSILEDGGEIFIITSDGQGLKQLTDKKLTDAFASISGDGKRIVLCSFRDNKAEISVVNSDGSGWFNFEVDPQINGIQSPRISSDGSMIAFEAGSYYVLPDVLVINYDGSSTESAPYIEEIKETDNYNYGYVIALTLGLLLVVVLVLFLRRKK